MVVFFMLRFIIIIVFFLQLFYSLPLKANRIIIEEHKFKINDNLNYSINALYPSSWKSLKIGNQLTIFNLINNSKLIINYVPFENKTNCYLGETIEYIDSKFFLIKNKNSALVYNKNNLKQNYIPKVDENLLVTSVEENRFLSKLPNYDTKYSSCITQSALDKVNFSLKMEFVSESDLNTIKDIIKSLNISDYVVPDKENQRTPLNAINDTLNDTPSSNIYIVIGIIGLLLLFSIFLVYTTRLKRDNNYF
jgi:hypothetical protein